MSGCLRHFGLHAIWKGWRVQSHCRRDAYGRAKIQAEGVSKAQISYHENVGQNYIMQILDAKNKPKLKDLP